MKQLLAAAICILITFSLYGQDNCFGKCLENFEKSTIPAPKKNEQILQELVGCKAPDFKVKSIEGVELSLAQLKGKVIVINFWFEGCAPCIAELPALNRLKQEYESKDVVFIAFGRDNTQSIKNFLKTRTFNYNIVSADFELSKDFCVMLGGWPTNMVFDKDGVLRQIFSGGHVDEKANVYAYDKMKPIIDQYLSE
jgi:peroxiredoxin